MSCLRMQAFLKSPIAVHDRIFSFILHKKNALTAVSIIPRLIPDDFYLLWLLKLSVCNFSVCSSISKKVTAPPPSWLQWSPGHGTTQTDNNLLLRFSVGLSWIIYLLCRIRFLLYNVLDQDSQDDSVGYLSTTETSSVLWTKALLRSRCSHHSGSDWQSSLRRRPAR